MFSEKSLMFAFFIGMYPKKPNNHSQFPTDWERMPDGTY
jgi:hypothetical protein